MADENETTEQQEPTDSTAEQRSMKSLVGRLLPWVILAVVVLSCAGAGFGLGRLFGGSQAKEAVKSEPGESVEADDLTADDESAEGPQKSWYYDLDPVVANLNEPSVTRYVRATFTLEMSAEVDSKEGAAFLDEKKPILINWLTVYLSSLSLDDIRGDKNLKSIQSRVREAFNEKLFPDSKPKIKQVLIKEFPVQ
ncbi:MAG: flagellar basal body-associated FliL family protein [Phycisphaerales bacterium]|nr:MAG: flagellar basal body-associated FliL family protein [Phycisphaerales bacterium]